MAGAQAICFADVTARDGVCTNARRRHGSNAVCNAHSLCLDAVLGGLRQVRRQRRRRIARAVLANQAIGTNFFSVASASARRFTRSAAVPQCASECPAWRSTFERGIESQFAKFVADGASMRSQNKSMTVRLFEQVSRRRKQSWQQLEIVDDAFLLVPCFFFFFGLQDDASAVQGELRAAGSRCVCVVVLRGQYSDRSCLASQCADSQVGRARDWQRSKCE